jgi:hypothetical protein
MVYANGMAPPSALATVEGVPAAPFLARRVRYLLREYRRRNPNGYIFANELYRIKGVPSDQYVRNSSETSTGGSNQWFQWGRGERGETPSAAWPPYGSEHGDWDEGGDGSEPGEGGAGDFNCDDIGLRDEIAAEVGMTRTISSETWHYGVRDIVHVDLGGAEFADLTKQEIKIRRDIYYREADMYVWTNKDYGKSYSVTNGSALHHKDPLTKAVALKSIGQLPDPTDPKYIDLDVKLGDFELAISLSAMGLGMFVDSDLHLTRFSDPHWDGRQFLAPWQDGGKFLAEFLDFYSAKA